MSSKSHRPSTAAQEPSSSGDLLGTALSSLGSMILGTQGPERSAACAFETRASGHDHDDGATSTRSETELDAIRPICQFVDTQTRATIVNTLRRSRTGAELLDQAEALGEKDFALKWSGKGTYHLGGEIFVNRKREPEELVASVAHELVHLITFASGNQADPLMLDRDPYVQAKMDDEMNAEAKSMLVELQLQGELPENAAVSLFSNWMDATSPEGWSDALADPTAEAARWQDIEDNARLFLVDRYANEYTGNTNHENYYEYWSANWDEKNHVTTRRADIRRGWGLEDHDQAPDPGLEHDVGRPISGAMEPAAVDDPDLLDAMRPVAEFVSSGARADIINSLQRTRSGADLLAQVRALGNGDFPIRWSDRGTYHVAGEIYVDRTREPEDLVAVVAHELVHLVAWARKAEGNLDAMDRETYVETMLTDEVDAETRAFLVEMELDRGRDTDEHADFYMFMDATKGPGWDEPLEDADAERQRWRVVEERAHAWVAARYEDKFVTENSGMRFAEHFGKQWDDWQTAC